MMVAPLLGVAARMAAKKAAKKTTEKEAKKQTPYKSRAEENKENTRDAMILTGALGSVVPASLGAIKVREAREQKQKQKELEAEDEMKRETRGMKSGGYVKAADGCAQRGKTKGRMV